MTQIDWRWRAFTDLSTLELFHALKLRAEIFVSEQGDAYTDPDDLDLISWHLLGYDSEGQLMAYGRIILPHGDQHGLKLGRIVVEKNFRGLQLGQLLLKGMLDWITRSDYRHSPIELNAQYHLEAFYQKFGFQSVGEKYLISHIHHIDMQREPMTAS